MPSFIIRNEEFAPNLTQVSYPFGERSSLETTDLYIGQDVFTDAIIYLKEAAQLPLHVSSMDGTAGTIGNMACTISDNTGRAVATCALSHQRDSHVIVSTEGVECGILNTSRPGLVRLLGRTAGTLHRLLKSTAEFVIDVTFVTEAAHVRYASVDGKAVTASGALAEEIEIVAGHGLKFTIEDGIVRLHLLGDAESVLDTGLRSINGVASPTIWLAAHPRANLRVSSKDGELSFTSARDAT